MNDLHTLSLAEACAGLRSGDISARELTEACLKRVREIEPAVHAFLHLAPESALEQADQADRRLGAWLGGKVEHPPPAVCGIPAAVKDVLTLRGVPTTAGSRILEGFRPPFTATSVGRLIEAGMVVLGKTNTDEFAMGSSTENSAYGVTHNPWNLERVPGGSSGGSAAAVASRMVPLALGTDTGGSVRQPASFCGVTGLKPTYGRVSRYGLIAYGSSLDSVGLLTRSARDLVEPFMIMGGHDPLDSTSSTRPMERIDLDSPSLSGLKIGLPREYFVGGVQAEVDSAIRAAADVFWSLGAEVVEVSLPHTDLAVPVYYILAPSEASANLARFDGIRYGPRVEQDDLWGTYDQTRGDLFGPEVKRRIMLGTYALSAGYYEAYYGQAQKVRTLITSDFDSAFGQVDLLACPVAPTTAFEIGAHRADPISMYLEDVFSLPANLAGVPGLSFPVGFDGDGLPIGMQLMGPQFGESLLVKAAHAYQLVTEWHKEGPAL